MLLSYSQLIDAYCGATNDLPSDFKLTPKEQLAEDLLTQNRFPWLKFLWMKYRQDWCLRFWEELETKAFTWARENGHRVDSTLFLNEVPENPESYGSPRLLKPWEKWDPVNKAITSLGPLG